MVHGIVCSRDMIKHFGDLFFLTLVTIVRKNVFALKFRHIFSLSMIHLCKSIKMIELHQEVPLVKCKDFVGDVFEDLLYLQLE